MLKDVTDPVILKMFETESLELVSLKVDDEGRFHPSYQKKKSKISINNSGLDDKSKSRTLLKESKGYLNRKTLAKN